MNRISRRRTAARSTKILLVQINLLIFAAALFLTNAAFAQQTAAKPSAPSRSQFTINDSWRFTAADAPNQQAADFDDASWETINLPHTWNTADAFDDAPGYRRGAGWYRKRLQISENLRGKQLFLYFEGANQIAEVWVNGARAGQHTGGYTAFAFDVTKLVKIAAENVIAVRLDNSHNPDVPPQTADFTFYGGIYRDVWLTATDQVHFAVTDHAASGVFVDTPQVSDESATVRVRGRVRNDSAAAKNLRIVSRIVDANGKVVAQTESKSAIQPAAETDFSLPLTKISDPRLWSPDAPNLYRVDTEILDGATTLDAVSAPLGLRWFKFDPNNGFFLNGKPMVLRGMNRHQDYKNIGNALPNSQHVRDLELIKQMGANFLRLAHYPQDPVVLETADRLGLIVWEEIPLVDSITTSRAFADNSKQMLIEMIRQHYNHPSILMWGYMNEILIRLRDEPDYIPKVVGLARELEDVVRREDAGRASVMAVNGDAKRYNDSGLTNVPQVLGWNVYFGWYEGVFEDFGKFMDEQHRLFPQRVQMISEYGADTDRRLHSLAPERFDYTIEWGRRFHESHVEQIEARPFIAGSLIWVGIDFGSEGRGESLPHTNLKGMLTTTRQPKDVYYFYQAKLSKEPVLHIATRDWTRRAGAVNAANNSHEQPIVVYTNLPQVELFANGVSLGRKTVDKTRRAEWQTPFKSGANVLEARGATAAGRAITDRAEIEFKLRPAQLAAASPPFVEIAVNAGSNVQYLDDSGTIWEADQIYTPGGWGFVGGAKLKTSRNILDTDDDALYQVMRENLKQYRFDVPDGEYEIELRFAEPKADKAGERVFTIEINGATVLPDFDLRRAAGQTARAVSRTFKISARGGAGVNINFKAQTGASVISAIRVRRTN